MSFKVTTASVALLQVVLLGGAAVTPARADGDTTVLQQLAVDAIKKLAEDPKAIGRYLQQFGGELPNAVTPTLGGHTFWKNLDTGEKWKLQQNTVTGHCRILDPNDYRFAWGAEAPMRQCFDTMKKNGMVLYNPQGLPEVPFGKWEEVTDYRDWKIQRNKLLGHSRIVDPNRRTVALGHEDGLRQLFAKVIRP